MGALTITSVLKADNIGTRHKSVIFTATGPASYDTNGSVLHLGSGNTVLTGLDPLASFEAVHGVRCLGVAAHGSDRYQPVYVRASGGAAATGTASATGSSWTSSQRTRGSRRNHRSWRTANWRVRSTTVAMASSRLHRPSRWSMTSL